MDDFFDDRDFILLEKDKFTFSALKRIAKSSCKIIKSNHTDRIICQSSSSYPIWIWLDDENEEQLNWAYNTVVSELPVTKGYVYQTKKKTADFFIRRSLEDGIPLKTLETLQSYTLDNLTRLDLPSVDGELQICNQENVSEAVDLFRDFYNELNMDQCSNEEYQLKARALIERKQLYFFLIASGEVAGCCSYSHDNTIASVGTVFTRHKYRRMGIAEIMVYNISKRIIESGMIPLVYTDADYIPSNRLYEKIGYTYKGSICRLGKKE